MFSSDALVLLAGPQCLILFVLTGASEAMDSMEYAKEVLVLHYNNPASFFFPFLLGCFSRNLTLIPKYCVAHHSQCISSSTLFLT
jgi:hypothetical protein